MQSKLAGDDHLLHLRGALPDLKHLRVAVEPGNWKLIYESVAAEYLGRVPRVVHRRVRRRQLGDRGLRLDRLARHQPGGRVVPGQPGSRRPGLHVGDLELDGLVVAKMMAERGPLPGVPQALVYAALREAGGERGDRDPAFVENLQELRVAASLRAEQIRGGNPAVAQRKLSGV